MNIKTLAKKVAREVKPDEYDELIIAIHRDGVSENFDLLRRSTKIELKNLQADLNRLIPNDFDYRIYFEDQQVDGQLIYMDGEDAGAGTGFPADLFGDYVRVLRKVDWDDVRKWTIPGANIQDEAAIIASDLSGELPSTAFAQKKFVAQYEVFKAKIENEKIQYGMLVYNDSLDEYEETSHDKRERLIGDIYDFLAFRWPIIAIVDDGKILDIENTERLKQECLDGLGPISKAKALGQFEVAMNMMM